MPVRFNKILKFHMTTMNEKSNSIFSRIIKREIPAKILYEDEKCIAIEDVNKQAPIHFLVIPKKPIVGIGSIEAFDCDLLGHMMLIVKEVADKEKLENGYRVVINNGSDGGQEVMHLHVHVMGGRRMKWPPG